MAEPKSITYAPYEGVDKAKIIKTIWDLNNLEPKEAVMLSTLVDKDWDRTFHPNNQFMITNEGLIGAGKDWAEFMHDLAITQGKEVRVDTLVDKILSMNVEDKVNLLSLMVSMTVEPIIKQFTNRENYG